VRGFVIGVAATAIAFLALTKIMSQVVFTGDAIQLIVLSVVFGVVNSLIKPVANILSLPISVLTLGLIGLVINGGLLLLTAWVADRLDKVSFTIAGFPTDPLSLQTFGVAIVAALVLSVISTVIGLVVHD
jgi:putative membrane protein